MVAETDHHLYLQTSSFIDWDIDSVGLLKNGSWSEPKGDFAIVLKALGPTLVILLWLKGSWWEDKESICVAHALTPSLYQKSQELKFAFMPFAVYLINWNWQSYMLLVTSTVWFYRREKCMLISVELLVEEWRTLLGHMQPMFLLHGICVVQNEIYVPNKQFFWKKRNVPGDEWHPVFCLHLSFEKQQARYAHLNSCLRTWATALWQCVGPGTCRFVLQQYCGSLLT